MAAARSFALVRTADQWRRCAHESTFLDAGQGVVSLSWVPADGGDVSAPPAREAGGLAFDNAAGLYRSLSDEGRIEWYPAPAQPGTLPPPLPAPLDLFAGEPPATLGDFAAPSPPGGPLGHPRGIGIDADDHLFIADAGTGQVLVFDLWERRLLRGMTLLGAGGDQGTPLDVACRGLDAWVVVGGPPGLVRLRARQDPAAVDLPRLTADLPAEAAPERVAAGPGEQLCVLYRDTAGHGWVVTLMGPGPRLVEVDAASDVEYQSDGALVVTRGPDATFLRFREGAEDTPLKARGYDGSGVVRTPDGRIGFWTPLGLRHALPARVRYAQTGRVTTYRLESTAFQTEWGRLFLDACIPPGTDVRAWVATADEVTDEPTVPRTPPGNNGAAGVPHPELSPPLPPVSLAPGAGGAFAPLHRRETGREIAWARFGVDDPFETYEAPIHAGAGRYLWVALELTGNGRFTPQVRCLRAEYPSHDYLRRLPRTFSRDLQVADFLRRYLAMFDGVLLELDSKAAERRALLDPASAPEEILPWLASFLGLALDERWPLAARRRLIDEAIWLFRFRGTPAGLARMLQIYVDSVAGPAGGPPGQISSGPPQAPVSIVEHFRFRGAGAAVVGAATAPLRSVVGGGLRVGGSAGGSSGAVLDDFQTRAHRFTVVVPAGLTLDQMDVVRSVIDLHRPAHVVFDLQTGGGGMRVSLGAHLGVSSLIGNTAGFTQFELGASALGAGAVVGRRAGTPAGTARLGRDTRIG